ncbi:MAG TPA: hypothetical protein VFR78_17050, partial [Pyrinomonadaceae bacterium]|nr:hypothetical protein [Pyrinomonadaceae bacterium]
MKLRKLKDASLDELRVRAAQRVAAFSERRGWSRLAKLPTDREFEALVASNGRVEAKFFASFESPEETIKAFR